MNNSNRYALLDTDFISKLFITRIDDSNRLIHRLLDIESFTFICHYQTEIELGRHNHTAADWLSGNPRIKIFKDRDLIQLMTETYGMAAYGYYVNMLRRSCDIFSRSFFDSYYKSVEQYSTEFWPRYQLEEFIAIIDNCDANIGTDNNLGEIKLYTMAQILKQLGTTSLYVFCTDDRKARYALSSQTDMECVSALASFYLAKNYLHMPKEEAQQFFNSWMIFHRAHGQERFPVYNTSGHQLEKLLGQDIFDMLYNDALFLMKDGLFQKK